MVSQSLKRPVKRELCVMVNRLLSLLHEDGESYPEIAPRQQET